MTDRAAVLKRRTAHRFGLLWAKGEQEPTPERYHYRLLREKLPAHELSGVVLDAGCGEGIDTAHFAADGASRVIGVELSSEGAAQAARRTAGYRTATIVQGDLEHLPLRDGACALVYSYGVLHHLPHPEQGFQELARVLRPGGRLVVYVYEDFSTHTMFARSLLRVVSWCRRLTVAMPARLLFSLCTAASPLVFAGFALPSRVLVRYPVTRPLGQRIPFRHAESPMSLAGDLYDRFAAPIERRYSRVEVAGWFERAGLQEIGVVSHRGWLGYGVKPGVG